MGSVLALVIEEPDQRELLKLTVAVMVICDFASLNRSRKGTLRSSKKAASRSRRGPVAAEIKTQLATNPKRS